MFYNIHQFILSLLHFIVAATVMKRPRGRPHKKHSEMDDAHVQKSPRRLRSNLAARTTLDALSEYPSLTPPSPTKKQVKRVSCSISWQYDTQSSFQCCRQAPSTNLHVPLSLLRRSKKNLPQVETSALHLVHLH
jgi:hypothetical protein